MKFTVNSIADIIRVSKAVQEMWETVQNELVVIIQKATVNRSLEQNKLMWNWLTVIGSELGNTKDEMHEIYKEKFLISIFVRDDQEYAEMAAAIKQVGKENKQAYEAIRKKVIKMTSTTDCSVKQMSEYLNNIKYHAQSELQISLPLPELRGLI